MTNETFLPRALFVGQRYICKEIEYEVVVDYDSGRLKWRKLYDPGF